MEGKLCSLSAWVPKSNLAEQFGNTQIWFVRLSCLQWNGKGEGAGDFVCPCCAIFVYSASRIWEVGNILCPSDGDCEWRFREQGWANIAILWFHLCLVIFIQHDITLSVSSI